MICPNCGKQINDGDIFCAYCRNRVDGQPAQQPVQPVFQQDTFNTYQTNNAQLAYQQATPANKQHPLAVFLTTLLVGGALISAFIMFIKPGYMLDRDDDDDRSSRRKKSDSSVSAVESKEDDTSEIVTTVTTAETEAPATIDESSEAETTTTTTTTTTTATAAETTTTTAATKSAAEIAREEANSYSTDQRPAFDEFEWCYGQFGLIRDLPEGTEQLTDPDAWIGGWKCMINYTPGDNEEIIVRELNQVYIDTDGSSASVTIDHYIYEIDGDQMDESYAADSEFSGSITEGWLDVIGPGRITMTIFWKENGHEYAVGEYLLQDGTEAYVALTR